MQGRGSWQWQNCVEDLFAFCFPKEGLQAAECDIRCVQRRGRGVKAAGRVKKGGAGGKFTWGGLMSPGLDRAPSPVLDRNDPNYESGEPRKAELEFGIS